MNVTYVTALFNVKKSDSISKNIFQDFKYLLSKKIPLIVYVDEYFNQMLDDHNVDIPDNVDVIIMDVSEMEIYKSIINATPALPPIRNLEKDTLEYMALMNSKVEFLLHSLTYCRTAYIAWIDSGIAKIFKDKNSSLSRLEKLSITELDTVVIPGAYKRDLSFEQLCNNVFWVFLGGFFVCNKNVVQKFYDLSVASVNKFLSSKRIAWEVNVWVDIHIHNPNFFIWYPADHNETIFNIPNQYSIIEQGCQDPLSELKSKVADLRYKGKNKEAFVEGRDVLRKEKNPFSSVNEDLSIVSYYIDRHEEGRICCERVLASPFQDKKNTCMANIAFYLKPLSKNSELSIHYELPPNFFPSSPSAIQYNGGYLYNIRAVNYTIRDNGSYDIRDEKGIVRTKNFVLLLDKKFEVTSSFELSDDLSVMNPRYPSHILGLEDVRMFKDNDNNKYFFATCCETKPQFCPRIVFGSFDDTGKLLFVKVLNIPNNPNNSCEKNWLPFVTSNNEIRFIYTTSPLTIYQINKITFDVSLVHVHQDERFNDYEFRGSAPPIRYLDGWLFTIHQVLYSTPRKYYHRFVWYNDSFTLRKYSPLFYFEKIGIEYNLSICPSLTTDDLLLTYSINDSCQKICSVTKEYVQKALEFSDYLLNTYMEPEMKFERKKGDKKLCLAMIVKNESKIIERCLKSCKDVLDYICICDTGSTDNTVELIENFCKEYNIPGKVMHHTWKNFGHNRTLSYQAAKETFPDADYCLLIDADMQLEVLPDFDKSKLVAGGYMVAQQGGGLYYYNTRLLGTKYNWKCVGVTHEYWSPEDPTCQTVQLNSLAYDDRGDGGAKADKFERDIRLLKQGLIDEPNNERYMFYMAQSHHDIGRYKEAMYWYRKRIRAGGWYEEVYYSYYRIARCKLGLNLNWDEVEQAYEEAWNNLKSRMEPLYEIGKHYQETEQYEKAYMWLKKASVIPFPNDQVLFIFKDIYEFRVWDCLGISAYYVGQYKEAVDCDLKALKSSFCTPHDAERIKNNMRCCIEKIKEKK